MLNNIISIIIPTFNQANYIKRCLESISNQTIKNYEIIIIDKYSKDNTKKIIEDFKSLPIKLFQIENQGIIANSRNYGIKKAKGDVIAFLDSDDYWKPNKLEESYKKIIEGYDLVFHNLELSGSKKKLFKKKILKGRKLNNPFFKDLIINGNPISNSSVIVKKKILFSVNLINEEKKMNAAEDYNLWIKISQQTEKFYFINKTLGYYQFNLQGASRKKNMSYATNNAIKNFFSLLNKKEISLSKARIFYMGAKYYYDKNKINFCKKKLLLAFKYGKLKVKIKSALLLFMIKFKK